jgi:DNA-binding MltR family transcriptional regulator
VVDENLIPFIKSYSAIHGQEELFDIIIRSHLQCEALLIQLLRQNLNNPNALDIDRLNYQIKLDLAYALSLLPRYIFESLRVLGKLRNKYSHNYNYEATVKEELMFLNSLSGYNNRTVKYFLSKKERFPDGIRRCLIVIWLNLYRIIYKEESSYSQRIKSFIKLLKQIHDLEIVNVIKAINK